MKKALVLMTFAVLMNHQFVFAQAPEEGGVTRTNQDNSNGISISGFYFEPLLSISQEDSSIQTSQLPLVNLDTSGNATGYGIGVKLGTHLGKMLLLGVDTRYSRMTTDDSFYNKARSDVFNFGPTIGVQTPYFGVRLLASYVLLGESNPDAAAQGIDLKFKEATGWRLGAGVYVASVSINLEYQNLTYGSTEVESIGTLPVNNLTSIEANNTGYAMSLSFPMEY
jgi:hypothetical protein